MFLLNENKFKIFDKLLVLIIIFFSLYLGFNYSKYHTDPWHWGSIASNAIDYINGFKLFKDIVMLWGPGQSFLYKIINEFYNINYYSIGLITSIVYALNLILSYIILIRLSNRFTSSIIFLFIFCLVPYPQVPWPDFYSGLFLTSSCLLLLISKNKNIFLFFAALFLTVTIVFRNSYIITIIPAIFCFYLIHLIHKKKIPLFFNKFVIYFTCLLFIFFLLLFLNNNLLLWYSQGLGRIGEYQITDSFILNYKINPSIYLIIKFFYHIIIPARLENLYFFILFTINIILVFRCILKKKIFTDIQNKNDKILFFSILGLCGIAQSFNQYEIWRHLNSSISLFFVLAYLLSKESLKQKYYKIILTFIIFFCLTLIPIPDKNGSKHFSGTNYFPLRGFYQNGKFVDHPSLYFKSQVKFFDNHLFNKENLDFYNELIKTICPYDIIINYSIDRTLGYICDKKNLIISTYPKNNERPSFHLTEIEHKYSISNIEKNEVIIADYRYLNQNLKLLKKILIPKYTRYTFADTKMQYFDEYIFIYIKK